MPEQLGPELLELQRSAEALAAGPLTELAGRDDLDHRALRAEVAAHSKRAGLFEMTRGSDGGKPSSALALAVTPQPSGQLTWV